MGGRRLRSVSRTQILRAKLPKHPVLEELIAFLEDADNAPPQWPEVLASELGLLCRKKLLAPVSQWGVFDRRVLQAMMASGIWEESLAHELFFWRFREEIQKSPKEHIAQKLLSTFTSLGMTSVEQKKRVMELSSAFYDKSMQLTSLGLVALQFNRDRLIEQAREMDQERMFGPQHVVQVATLLGLADPDDFDIRFDALVSALASSSFEKQATRIAKGLQNSTNTQIIKRLVELRSSINDPWLAFCAHKDNAIQVATENATKAMKQEVAADEPSAHRVMCLVDWLFTHSPDCLSLLLPQIKLQNDRDYLKLMRVVAQRGGRSHIAFLVAGVIRPYDCETECGDIEDHSVYLQRSFAILKRFDYSAHQATLWQGLAGLSDKRCQSVVVEILSKPGVQAIVHTTSALRDRKTKTVAEGVIARLQSNKPSASLPSALTSLPGYGFDHLGDAVVAAARSHLEAHGQNVIEVSLLMSFGRLVPEALELRFKAKTSVFPLKIESQFPSHIDVMATDRRLARFKKALGYEEHAAPIWGDVYQLPDSLLYYELGLACEKLTTLVPGNKHIRTRVGDGEQWLAHGKDLRREQGMRKELQALFTNAEESKAFVSLLYASQARIKWLI